MRYVQLCGGLIQQRDSLDIEPRLQSSRLRVKAAVDDATVGLAGPHGDIVLLFEQAYTQPITAKLAGNHRPDDTGSCNHYIIIQIFHI